MRILDDDDARDYGLLPFLSQALVVTVLSSGSIPLRCKRYLDGTLQFFQKREIDGSAVIRTLRKNAAQRRRNPSSSSAFNDSVTNTGGAAKQRAPARRQIAERRPTMLLTRSASSRRQRRSEQTTTEARLRARRGQTIKAEESERHVGIRVEKERDKPRGKNDNKNMTIKPPNTFV